MTALDTALADYLAVRRAVGYHLVEAGRQLGLFVAHLNGLEIDTVTVAVSAEWAAATKRGATGAQRLSAIRGFARYLQALDPVHEVPPTGLLPVTRTRPVPHLYSETDIDALMVAARQLDPQVWSITIETMIGLLWVTGMRVGEVLRLNVADIDYDQAVLTVWLSKFGKSRHVPVTASTITALICHKEQVPSLGPALFVGNDGERVRYPHFKKAFDRLVDDVGIVTGSGARPRVHDLRHSFATRTLLGWYRTGADVHMLVPRLSTYLGHVEPASTYWYLSAAPELMACAAARLEQHQARS